MRALPCGDRAVLLELDDHARVLGLRTWLSLRPPVGAIELVPGARTLLVTFDPRLTDAAAVVEAASAAEPHAAPVGAGTTIEVPVVYDGEDLGEVAAETGLSPEDVVGRHLRGRYTAAFCGFSPGFAYLTGLDPALAVGRRAEPRTRVPAGSVALAAGYTAVYPQASPGGWRIIGRTPLRVWDAERDPPALLPPGTVVRFVRLEP